MRRPRAGFTLIELLISVSVILILASIVLLGFSVLSDDETKQGARSIQSYIEGARDRAIYRKQPVGIRLIVDDAGTVSGGVPITANALVYVASPSETLTGQIPVIGGPHPSTPGIIIPADPINQTYGDDRRVISVPPVVWSTIETNRGTLNRSIQMPIEIEVGTVSPPVFENFVMAYSPVLDRWVLTKGYERRAGAAFAPPYYNKRYRLNLLPSIMSNQQQRELPRGAVIDLVDSKIPGNWITPGGHSPYLDIMFSPRGTVVGSSSGSGFVHLHVCGVADRERVTPGGGRLVMGNPRNEQESLIVSINPTTGNISVSKVPVFVDADADDIPDVNQDADPLNNFDPFSFAESGEVAQ